MWAAAGALAPEAGDRVAGAPGGPAAGDAQPASPPARVRVMAAMVRLFMITSVKSGVVIDRDGGLGAVLVALGGDRPGGFSEAAGPPVTVLTGDDIVFLPVCCPDGEYAAA